MILAGSERYRHRQRTKQTQYRNKSHVTSYVYRTAWNRSRVKGGGARSSVDLPIVSGRVRYTAGTSGPSAPFRAVEKRSLRRVG